MNEQCVIQVNENDTELGYVPKMEAHEKGLLHRAVSVLIFNSRGEWLLQQRAHSKYHSPGKWTNTTCTHPQPGETNTQAAIRRLEEEMGLRCVLWETFSFIYKAEFDNGLTEYEFDHVFWGVSDDLPILNPHEAAKWRYINTEELQFQLKNKPDNYTEWFKLLVPMVVNKSIHHGVKLVLNDVSATKAS